MKRKFKRFKKIDGMKSHPILSSTKWYIILQLNFTEAWYIGGSNVLFNIENRSHKSPKQLRIDHIFCSVHEEITSIRLYTPCKLRKDWGYFEWTEQIISINPYKLIHFFLLWDWKIYLFFQNKANNRKKN